MGQRHGDWFFVGALAMLGARHLTDLPDTALFFGALAIGWAINEGRRKRDA